MDMTWLFFYRESESLIKSWSTWDLARLAPEQANYLDCFSEEPRSKKAYRYPWVLLACLTACLTACWLGSENGEWRRFFIEIHAKHHGVSQGMGGSTSGDGVTREERFWPISMGLFEELDFFMAAHLSNCTADILGK